jgi:Xaa-Pro aminopeptidase
MQKDKARIETLVAMAKRNKLDALVFVHPENVLLGAGLLASAQFTVCVITRAGRVIVITPWWRRDAMQSGSWADQVIGFNWLKTLKWIDPVEAICENLSRISKKWKIRSVGFDGSFEMLGPCYIPSTSFPYGQLKRSLKKVFKRTTDVTKELHRVRSIKTPHEIRMLKRANKVSKAAARAFYKHARAGIRESDLAAEVIYAVQKQAGANGIGFTFCDPPQITSGPKRTLHANPPVCPATGKKLKTGELVMLELGGCADGFWFDLTRTLVIGKPKPVHKEMAAAIKEAMDAAYAAYRQGARTGGDLTAPAFKVMKDFKKGLVHGIGHGLGFAYHEVEPGIGPGSTDVIEPGMVTSMEPGIYLPGIGGIRIEENVLWRENDVLVLSDFHNDLGGWSE